MTVIQFPTTYQPEPEAQPAEPFTSPFDRIDVRSRKALKQAGCVVKRVGSGKWGTWEVTFPAGTHHVEEVQFYGMIRAYSADYTLPTGQVFHCYSQGHEGSVLYPKTTK